MAQRNAGSRSTRKPRNLQPKVVVKFEDWVALPYKAGAERAIEQQGLGPVQEFLQRFGGATFDPLFGAKRGPQLRKLVKLARSRDDTYRPPNLLTYFEVPVPQGADPQEAARSLAAWPSVALAYVAPGPVEPPLVDPTDDPRSVFQGYLDPAPDGVDAEYAWGVTGGDGAGQALVDLEWGWNLNHEDLAGHGATLISGLNHSWFSHGTSVLGEIAAIDNAVGCVGITPELSSVRVVGQWRTGGGYSTTDAIIDAAAVMSFGDVLLLEAQTTQFGYVQVPVELEPAAFDVIRLATALGVVVVEAGGNGGVDLDAVQDSLGRFVLNRTHADFQDSGAIIVGAADSTAPHGRLGFSCFGSRIDCYGWGQSVNTTATDLAGTDNTDYTTTFNGTSSASPIVAGAALAVQGVAEANLGYRFAPRQLRVILSDPAHNTASETPATDMIGVMPDLRQILDDVLNVTPDVYLRDNIADVGDPHTGSISASPDIILRPESVADPQAAFGEGSGTESSQTLGYSAEAGQANYIYVRARNRGGSDAAGTEATIYWSEVSTLVTPDLWNLIGTTGFPTIPSGDQLTLANELVWPKPQIPSTGHYCFVGLIGNAQDPAPDPADFVDFDNFRRFIRDNNNVTWRNFNVEDNLPDPPSVTGMRGFKALPFLAPGAPDKARPMALEVIARLPRGARLLLELPAALAAAMKLGRRLDSVQGAGTKRRAVVVPLQPAGRERLGTALFPAKSRSRMRLLVQIPKELRAKSYDVAVRQLYRGEEVGRVTWRLSPKREQRAKKRRKRR